MTSVSNTYHHKATNSYLSQVQGDGEELQAGKGKVKYGVSALLVLILPASHCDWISPLTEPPLAPLFSPHQVVTEGTK